MAENSIKLYVYIESPLVIPAQQFSLKIEYKYKQTR